MAIRQIEYFVVGLCLFTTPAYAQWGVKPGRWETLKINYRMGREQADKGDDPFVIGNDPGCPHSGRAGGRQDRSTHHPGHDQPHLVRIDDTSGHEFPLSLRHVAV